MRSRTLLRRLWLVGVLVLLTALIGFAGWSWAANWRPRVSDFPVQGIDVSEDDDAIDWWAARKSGVSFAYARATVGATYRDPGFPEHWRGTYAAGVARGALHVYSLCQLATDQAGNFVSTVARSDEQLSPAILFDFQPDCAARPDRAVLLGEIGRFLQAVETHTGKQAILKVSKAFEAEYRLSEATDRALWSIQAFFPPGYMARPWTMWQASGFRRIEGAATPVRWNVMTR